MNTREDFTGSFIKPETAEGGDFEPVTAGYAPAECEALANAARTFKGCRIAFVVKDGRIEIWRRKAEVKRWSQKEEVNESTAIRLKSED